MKIVDSNIIIYAAREFPILRVHLNRQDVYLSEISKLEVLGYPDLKQADKLFFEAVFARPSIINIDSDIIEEALRLKKQRKISVCDAIIAATAILYDLELVTRNTKDFDAIKGLRVSNPLG
jgi:toxin FitB